MRGLVVVLALFACLKVGGQYYLASTAKTEIIVAAYRDRAANACARASTLQQFDVTDAWSRPSEIKLVVGKPGLDVALWQVNHALWRARFKNPYLFLTIAGNPDRILCEFDVVQGAAAISRL